MLLGNNNHNGFTFTEMLIAIGVLAVMSLSLAEFSQNMFNVSYDHSVQMEKASQIRFTGDLISNELHKASYIFPSAHSVSIETGSSSVNIDTSEAIVYLVESDVESDPQGYYVRAFYPAQQDDGYYSLYHFSSSSEIYWSENTLPNSIASGVEGSISEVMTDIVLNSSTLEYVLNFSDGISDTILMGSLSNVSDSDSYALIKGVNWNLVLNKESMINVNLGGLSNNVPRFVD